MNYQNYTNLITAISQDNVTLFSDEIKDKLNIRFGRFPILSICYLYNSKKILNKFEKQLWQIKDYTIINEPFIIYQKFRSTAGRILRLYTNEKAIITPIEMLAILHCDSKVKRLYRKYKQILRDKTKRNLKSIYTIYNQDPYILTYKIKIKPRKLTTRERLPYKIALSCSLATICVFVSILLTLNFTIGLGTSNNPYKIYTEKQFLTALNSTSTYQLTNNLQLSGNIDISTFKGTLNGNGHTITITSSNNNYLIHTNKGTLKNLNIVYPSITKTINSSFSLFTYENNGTIDNVNISINSLNLVCQKSTSTDIYVTGITKINNGLIDNCSVKLDLNIQTNGTGECFVSGIAGENNDTIRNSIILENSNITTIDADTAGIASSNTPKGKIFNCKNYANISQLSELIEWSPTIAGITLTNYGSINSSNNFGTLTVNSTNNEDNSPHNIFVGGISANNFGSISKCLNKGDITTTSLKLITYAGGIIGYSSYWSENNQTYYPVIDNCGSTGILNISTENDNILAFAGGIGGSFQYGEILDCYSLTEFTHTANSEKYFFGLLLGSSYLDIWFNNIFLSPSNNYLEYSDNVESHIGALINGNSIISIGVNLNEGITVTTEEQIKLQEIYFNE